ncbi:MAG TPA: DUF4386 domain-containing protein [Thermoanaerobaculia bacterium]|nr:DUF4386 domain-containing protein [Thermoanaerobaculia bacterium]
MNLTEHPRLLARVAGAFYVIITASALFAYMYVRRQVIIPGDMAQTATNILAHERLYRLGFSAAVVTVLCNPPMGFILYELLKIVNPRIALLSLVFITISTTIEAVNLFTYITPLFIFSLPEYRAAFGPAELQALARGTIKLWGYVFSVSLSFFGVFCLLTGYLLFKSKFFPRVLGVLMAIAGAYYLTNYSFVEFLGLPEIPYIGMLRPTLVGEVALALWLLVVGVNETKWLAQAHALQNQNGSSLS